MVSKTATMQSSGERWRKSLENILCVNQDPAEAIGHSDIFFLVYGLNSLPVWNKMSPVMKGRLTQTLGEFLVGQTVWGAVFIHCLTFYLLPFQSFSSAISIVPESLLRRRGLTSATNRNSRPRSFISTLLAPCPRKSQ